MQIAHRQLTLKDRMALPRMSVLSITTCAVTTWPYRSMQVLDRLEDDDGVYYLRLLIEGLEDDTEVDLAQDEHDNWKLGYVQTPDENWTVMDLGHFDDEGRCLWPLMTDWPSCWSGRS